MIITQLTLHNFGVYAGTNHFQFHNQKPVVLICGMNGRGKTTFLEAVQLVLYGSNSAAYIESSYPSYRQYLKAHINQSDGTLCTYLELSFKMSVRAQEEYLIRREWAGVGHRGHEKVTVRKDSVEDPFLTENWSMFVESILPCGLSSFFFFDGEKIAELAAEHTNKEMKNAIRALLGITVLDRLESDLERMLKHITKTSVNELDSEKIEHLYHQKELAEASLQAADEEIALSEKKLTDSRKAIDQARNEYKTKGGEIVAQQQGLFNKRLELTARIEQLEHDLVNMAAEEMPLCLVSRLLEDISLQADREQEQNTRKSVLDGIDSMFERFRHASQNDPADVQRFIAFIKSTAAEEQIEPIYGLSDYGRHQAAYLHTRQLRKIQQDASAAIKELHNLHTKLDEIDGYLSIDIDEKALVRIYRRIKEMEQEELDLSIQLEEKKKKWISLHSDALRAATEYNRYVESALKNLELGDDVSRIACYTKKAAAILDTYRVRLQKNKVEMLARTMTDCYKKIASKKNLIDQIQMDPITLDFVYIDCNGGIIPQASLSAGEKQLMVIAMLWSLAICSKWKLPVIIDTPLARLDSAHRLALITSYFPNASDQTIILSTDFEIDSNYYNLLKESVDDEFTLVYDEERKCSIIKRGYFTGADL